MKYIKPNNMEQKKINGQLYRQVFVNGKEENLPKEDEKYYFHTIGNFTLRFCSPNSATFRQIKKHIDWYLQLEPDPSELISKYKELVRNLKFAWLPVTKDQDEVVKQIESEIAAMKQTKKE